MDRRHFRRGVIGAAIIGRVAMIPALEVATGTVAGLHEYRATREHFANCLLDGQPVRCPRQESAANLRTMAALYRSARNAGRPERDN